MTAAVCLSCGAIKHGAWTACPNCKYDPSGKGLEEEAKALWLSSHFLKRDQLESAGKKISAKETPDFNWEYIEQRVKDAKARGKTTLVPSKFITCGLLLFYLAILCAIVWKFVL